LLNNIAIIRHYANGNGKRQHSMQHVLKYQILTSIRHYHYNQGIYYCNVSFSNWFKLKLFKVFSFPIFWFWYPMKIITWGRLLPDEYYYPMKTITWWILLPDEDYYLINYTPLCKWKRQTAAQHATCIEISNYLNKLIVVLIIESS
jgi:hypothetical protein